MRIREKNDKKIETKKNKNETKTAFSSRLYKKKRKLKRNRTITYLDWLSWFPAKEGKK